MKAIKKEKLPQWYLLVLPSSSGSSALAFCFSTGSVGLERGVTPEGGGLITLAFNPVAEGDSWDYRGEKQYH